MSSLLSKKQRFEVLKRDDFRCRYCGRGGDDVVLHVDHIVPVSKGGSSGYENLVTSCRECNLGKGNRELEGKLPALDEQPVVVPDPERLKRLLEYGESLKRVAEAKKAVIDQLVELFKKVVTDGREMDCEAAEKLVGAINRFLDFLVPEKIVHAMKITRDKFFGQNGFDSMRLRYFCGVCWQMIYRQTEEEENKAAAQFSCT